MTALSARVAFLEAGAGDAWPSVAVPVRRYRLAEQVAPPGEPRMLRFLVAETGTAVEAPPFRALTYDETDRVANLAASSAAPAGRDARADAPFVFAVGYRVPDHDGDELDRWYREEHNDILFTCPDWWLVRRFRLAAAGSAADDAATHLALHYLGDAGAIRSAAIDRARATPWRQRLAARPWYRGEFRLLRRAE